MSPPIARGSPSATPSCRCWRHTTRCCRRRHPRRRPKVSRSRATPRSARRGRRPACRRSACRAASARARGYRLPSSSCRPPALTPACSASPHGASASWDRCPPRPRPDARPQDRGRDGLRRHGCRRQPHRRRRARREHRRHWRSEPRARGHHAERLRQGAGARVHRHALALGLASLGQPARRVQDPSGRHHRGGRQLRILAGAGHPGVRRDDLRGFALYVPPGMDFTWPGFAEYLRAFDSGGTALNVVQLVGHGTLRIAAMGFARRPPAAAELTRMQRLMGEAVEAGAWGLSTGLIYAPGSYATTEEIVDVARVAGSQGGFYASHIRGEGATLLDAVTEAIRVGREARLPVQVSHVKAAGRPNWGKVERALALIDAARGEGLDVMADVYPYTASSTTLRTLLPDWALEGGVDAMIKRLADGDVRARIRKEIEAPVTGQSLLDRIGWENVMISYCARRKDAEGKRLSEVGAARGMDPLDAALELIVDEAGKAYIDRK